MIPSHNESVDSIQELLLLPETQGSALVILIVNRPDSMGADGDDLLLWNALHKRYPVIWRADPGILLYGLPNTDNALLVVDRFSENQQIPQQQGVGLARKIGADIACRLIHDGKIASRWIHSTDADVRLPPGYFQSPDLHIDSAALIFPFQHHCPEPPLQPFIGLYEFKLRYYVAALQWSGSHYGFHTIGSLICINVDNYAQVRGFPKRNAGEDFYLLNKLAKTGQIRTLAEPTIQIEARLSRRVPFGTGPALFNIQSLQQPLEQYRFYHPQSFIDLAIWQGLAAPLWHARPHYQQRGLRHTFKVLIEASDDFWMMDGGLKLSAANSATRQAERLAAVLGSLKLDAFLSHGFRQCSTQQAFQKQLSDWFDGLKTLRFIHQMRDLYFENVCLSDLTASYSGWLREICRATDQPWFTLDRATQLQKGCSMNVFHQIL